MAYVPPYLPRRPRSDYINAPAIIARRTTAKRRGWAAGWPDHCPTEKARTIVSVPRPGDTRIFNVSVDKRLGEIVGLLLGAIQEFGHPLIGAAEVAIAPNGEPVKQGGVSSFACRAIKGSNPPQPSNHSSATALDLWSRSNVQMWTEIPGATVPFKSTWHPVAVELVAAADFYWGGWYWDDAHDYVDAMHIEYMRRPQDVPESLAKLKAKIAKLRPEEPEVTPEQVKVLQTSLNAAGANPKLVVDGVYGPMTASAVLALPGIVDSLEATIESQTASIAGLEGRLGAVATGATELAAEALTLANQAGA